jgi:hypothetical protein
MDSVISRRRHAVHQKGRRIWILAAHSFSLSVDASFHPSYPISIRRAKMSTEQTATNPSKEFFGKMRIAAENEDFDAVNELLDEAGSGAYGVAWQAAPTLNDLKQSICKNLAAIIRICDSIINDPKADSKEVAWAKNKKKTSQDQQEKQKCEKQPVA